MRKLVFLCRRRPDITHAEYAKLLVEGHIPIALEHHPALRKYVVNVVDRVQIPGSRELDSIGELSFGSLEDYRERLYGSAEAQRIVAKDVAGFMGGADSYECTEHIQKHYRVAPPLPRRSPGVKLIAAVKRRSDLTHQQFVEHWLTRHVPLALEHHIGLTKYVTNVVDSRLSPAGDDYDGFGELCFASEADYRDKLFDSAGGRRIIEEDMARFLGPMEAWFVTEYVAKLPGAEGIP